MFAYKEHQHAAIADNKIYKKGFHKEAFLIIFSQSVTEN